MTSHEFAFNLAGHIVGVKKLLRGGARVTRHTVSNVALKNCRHGNNPATCPYYVSERGDCG